MRTFPQKLAHKLEERRRSGALRSLPEALGLIDFSSNDYLGFAKHEALAASAARYVHTKPQRHNGATGSRLLSGNHPLYNALEDFLKEYHQAEAALVFNSGYDANVGFFASVPQRGDVVFYDELIHASIRDGLLMSRAKSYKFPHNNLHALRSLVERISRANPTATLYIVTESVFSMDGDSPNIKALAAFCTQNNCHLVVDEAHAVGVSGSGRGLVAELGVQHEVFARIVTFGKALGTHGAAVLGSAALKAYLTNFARSLIYTTALPPHSLAAILAAYHQLKDAGEEYRQQLQENITYFQQQLHQLQLSRRFIKSHSAIQCAVVPGNTTVKALSIALQHKGYTVKPILSPTVKKGEERLRFCLHAYNTKAEIAGVLQELQQHIL